VIAAAIGVMVRRDGAMLGFCRDCLRDALVGSMRCETCGSPRVLRHPELASLSVAHIDCDAFYATIEKRDDPRLLHRPVIVGGGKRGVVAAACYVARTYGVRSAMPMFEARRLCPDAVVIRPNMEKYLTVAREVRRMMLELTPCVEPVSIDEAFMDLTGTARLHGSFPAKALAQFASRIESTIGVSISVGLSGNKFLAKIASDLEKPRGFAVLGMKESREFLKSKPVSLLWGVGKVMQARLARDGFASIGDLAAVDAGDLRQRYGTEGIRLGKLAHGIDERPVTPEREPKSISAETTFEHDTGDFRVLERRLWQLCEKVSARLKGSQLAGSTVTLKLKTRDFRLLTRARGLGDPTQLAVRIFAAGRDLLAGETDGTQFRLIGIAVSELIGAERADPPDLVDPTQSRAAAAEHAVDRLRDKFGHSAVFRGLSMDGETDA
jgi:DNA polymerase IV